MSDAQATATLLACPKCGGTSFSWLIEVVQFGDVQQYPDGSYDEIGMKRGDVVGSDVEDNGVFCTECEEHRARADLVPAETLAPTGEETQTDA